MELKSAIHLINSANTSLGGIWADIGAGTGLFCQALDQLLPLEASIYAVDKNPHVLYNLSLSKGRNFHIVEGNFEQKMELPICDGILMANALHYSRNPQKTLENILQYLRVGSELLIIEYETSIPNPPWVPYPLPFSTLEKILKQFPLSDPIEIGRVPSRYGASHIYAALCQVIG